MPGEDNPKTQKPARQALRGLVRLTFGMVNRASQLLHSSTQSLRDVYQEALDEHNAERAAARSTTVIDPSRTGSSPGTSEGNSSHLIVPGAAPSGIAPEIIVPSSSPDKAKRGRPKKDATLAPTAPVERMTGGEMTSGGIVVTPGALDSDRPKRGRPKKSESSVVVEAPRKPGRPKKNETAVKSAERTGGKLSAKTGGKLPAGARAKPTAAAGATPRPKGKSGKSASSGQPASPIVEAPTGSSDIPAPADVGGFSLAQDAVSAASAPPADE